VTNENLTRLERIAMLLDGQLTPDQRHEIEREIHASPEARAQFEAMRRIDATLAARFAEAAAPTTFDPASAPAPARPLSRRLALGAIAALVVLSTTTWFLWPAGQWPKPSARPTTIDGLFDKYVRSGFTPEFRCENDEQFLNFTKERLGVPLLASASPGVQLLGWGYPRDPSEMGLADGTVSLLARVDGKNVLVLMTPVDRDAHPRTQWLLGRNVFQNTVGGVYLLEITPFKESRVINLFKDQSCPGSDPETSETPSDTP